MIATTTRTGNGNSAKQLARAIASARFSSGVVTPTSELTLMVHELIVSAIEGYHVASGQLAALDRMRSEAESDAEVEVIDRWMAIQLDVELEAEKRLIESLLAVSRVDLNESSQPSGVIHDDTLYLLIPGPKDSVSLAVIEMSSLPDLSAMDFENN